LASSLDGVFDDCIVEVKCPFTARNSHITPETIPYVCLDETTGLWSLVKNHEYYYQVQGQLYVLNRSKCYFTVYTLCDVCDIVVDRDEQFITQMCAELDDFFERFFKPVLLEKPHRRPKKTEESIQNVSTIRQSNIQIENVTSDL